VLWWNGVVEHFLLSGYGSFLRSVGSPAIRHALACVGLEFLFTKYVTGVTQGAAASTDEGAVASSLSSFKSDHNQRNASKGATRGASSPEKSNHGGDSSSEEGYQATKRKVKTKKMMMKKKKKKKRKAEERQDQDKELGVVESTNGNQGEYGERGVEGREKLPKMKHVESKIKKKTKMEAKAEKGVRNDPLSDSDIGGGVTSGAETEPEDGDKEETTVISHNNNRNEGTENL
jgi:hypothetical protein